MFVFSTVSIFFCNYVTYFELFLFLYIISITTPLQYAIYFSVIIFLISGDIHPNPGPLDNISCVHLNVRSLRKRISKNITALDLITTEYSTSFDFILLTETWLDSNVSSDTLSIPNFHAPLRKDRLDGHGGVAVYIRNSFFFKRRSDLETDNAEGIWVETIINDTCFLFGAFYRPPNSKNDINNSIFDSFSLAATSNIQNILIFGDFNIDFLTKTSSFIHNAIQIFDLKLLINNATRYDPKGSRTLIDLILSNCPQYVSASGCLDNLCSDHCPVYCRLSFKHGRFSSFKRSIWNYQKANLVTLRQDARNNEWDAIIDHTDIEASSISFTSELIRLAKKNIPNKIVTIRPRDQPWMNNTIRHMSRKKNKVHRKAVRSNSENDWAKFRKIRNDYIKLIRRCKNDYYESIDKKINDNGNFGQKTWWQLVNSYVKKNKNQIGDLPPLVNNGVPCFTPEDKANCLNNFFISQSQINFTNANLPTLEQNTNSLCNVKLTPQEVKDIISTLDESKANGPDEISVKVIKVIKSEICSPLCTLFNLSLEHKLVPSIWKSANVTALFKKGDPSDCSNYRPISLLSIIVKIFEKCIYKHVFNFLRVNTFTHQFIS